MTDAIEKARAELERYRSISKQMKYTQERIEQITNQIEATNKPPREADIQHNSDPKKVEILLCELADLREMYLDIARTGAEFCRVLEHRIKYINGVPGLILQRHYIEGKQLVDVAIDLDYSYRQAKRLHYKGLCEYARMMGA